jgi:hypothetical protein
MEETQFQSNFEVLIAFHKAQDDFFNEVKESNVFLEENEVRKFLKCCNQYLIIVCNKE